MRSRNENITQELVISLQTEPVEEPITLLEAKAHLRVDISDDDDLITSLIIAAREYVEKASRRTFITQTWKLSVKDFSFSEMDIPLPPLQSISSITYRDSEGNTNTVNSTVYEVDSDSEPGKVNLAYGKCWPTATLAVTNPVQITFVSGYGDADAVPQKWKQAILLLVASWYENRESILTTGAVPQEIPFSVKALIKLDRG